MPDPIADIAGVFTALVAVVTLVIIVLNERNAERRDAANNALADARDARNDQLVQGRLIAAHNALIQRYLAECSAVTEALHREREYVRDKPADENIPGPARVGPSMDEHGRVIASLGRTDLFGVEAKIAVDEVVAVTTNPVWWRIGYRKREWDQVLERSTNQIAEASAIIRLELR